LVRCTI